jgi:predicted small secreted protein
MLKRFIIGIMAATLLVLSSTGCNTMRGAGEDIENVGESVQDNT